MGNWVTLTSVFFPQSFPKQNVKKGEKLSCSAQNLLGLCIKMYLFIFFKWTLLSP